MGVNHTLCLILSLELLDVLDVNTAIGLLGDRAVSVTAEKNFDGITGDDCHLREFPWVYLVVKPSFCS
jgi:hypothetical protein